MEMSLTRRLPAWARWNTTTGKILIGSLVVVVVAGLWALVSINRDSPVEYDDIAEHFPRHAARVQVSNRDPLRNDVGEDNRYDDRP